VQVKLCYPLTMRAIPEHLRGVSCIGATQIDITLPLLTRTPHHLAGIASRVQEPTSPHGTVSVYQMVNIRLWRSAQVAPTHQ